MSYNPQYKLYYVKSGDSPSENNRLVPAPKLSITPEYYYANNIVVGYTYNIKLNGTATSIDLRSYDGIQELGFSDVLESIKTVKNIFNNNGGSLIVRDAGNATIFQASGINVKSIEFSESDNKWINYAPYSIDLEANEVLVSNCSGIPLPTGCNIIPSGLSISPEFIDMKKYRIKSFDDSWKFNVNENSYNSYQFSGVVPGQSGYNFNNEYIEINYSINANGKHYFVDNKLLPAWEQAKNFCQYRLYNQVKDLIYVVLPASSGTNGCSGIADLTNIFSTGNLYALSGLASNEYKIFNEKINCETSEAGGTFSLNYDAILKRTASSGTDFIDANSIHTFEISKNITNDGTTKNIAFNIQGNIQGLVEGGLIRSSGILSLPQNGQILLSNPSGNTSKYDNALSTYTKITNTNRNKLKNTFASILGVSYSGLGISGVCYNPTGVPNHNSFSNTHDYSNGTITYNVSYDSNTGLVLGSGITYSNVTISLQDSVPQIAEFIIPGRSGGPIIQNIVCDTPKKISINIDGGFVPGYFTTCCPTFEDLLASGCFSTPIISGIPSGLIDSTMMTENRQNYSTDGSFSISRSYIYYSGVL